TFHWPRNAGEPGAKIRLAPQALQLLLDGVDLKDGARRAWKVIRLGDHYIFALFPGARRG
ncbi:MAG TPA: hypothetical protein VFC44_04775, partial [Candidatus Saccharimonadales bacterium]|nr:hypothetical protein [Candidatus Saccharimonadales bacterium]